jgi:hypothetical protein
MKLWIKGMIEGEKLEGRGRLRVEGKLSSILYTLRRRKTLRRLMKLEKQLQETSKYLQSSLLSFQSLQLSTTKLFDTNNITDKFIVNNLQP